MKIKGSQGNPRREWVKTIHPYTIMISPEAEIHGNHNEALNTAIRRKCSAYRRRQNLYAKKVEGLNRAITVQRLIPNWVIPFLFKFTTDCCRGLRGFGAPGLRGFGASGLRGKQDLAKVLFQLFTGYL